MKKILGLVVSLMAVLVLSACAATGGGKKTYTYRDMVVGFIQTGSEGGWRAANTASFKETAGELGLKLKFYDAQNKLENQVCGVPQFHRRQGSERHRARRPGNHGLG